MIFHSYVNVYQRVQIVGCIQWLFVMSQPADFGCRATKLKEKRRRTWGERTPGLADFDRPGHPKEGNRGNMFQLPGFTGNFTNKPPIFRGNHFGFRQFGPETNSIAFPRGDKTTWKVWWNPKPKNGGESGFCHRLWRSLCLQWFHHSNRPKFWMCSRHLDSTRFG